MGMKTYVAWAIGAIAVWVVGVLVLYGIIYVNWVLIFGIRCDSRREQPVLRDAAARLR